MNLTVINISLDIKHIEVSVIFHLFTKMFLAVYWSSWSNQNSPTEQVDDDYERLSGSKACLYPVAIQAQTAEGVSIENKLKLFYFDYFDFKP